MLEQLSLLTDAEAIPLNPPPVSREKAISDALEHQMDEFKKAFLAYARGFYRTQTGEVAKVVGGYDETNLPKPVKDYRAIGGIIQGMVKRGEIKSIGTVKAGDGSGRNMDVYARAGE